MVSGPKKTASPGLTAAVVQVTFHGTAKPAIASSCG
jgi:hypothetical protein